MSSNKRQFESDDDDQDQGTKENPAKLYEIKTVDQSFSKRFNMNATRYVITLRPFQSNNLLEVMGFIEQVFTDILDDVLSGVQERFCEISITKWRILPAQITLYVEEVIGCHSSFK